MSDERSGAGWAIAGCVLTCVGGVPLTLFLGFFWVLNCFDGDGGAPYVATGSPQHAVCSAVGDDLGWLIPVGWVVGVAVAIVALVRWSHRRWATAVLVGAVLAPVVLPAVVFYALNLPSDHCADLQSGAAQCATY